MTLNEFLLKTNVDVNDNKSLLGNQLGADMARQGININFNKDIDDVTEEELYEIGRILILSENTGKHFFCDEFVSMMKKIIEKHK